MWIITILQRLHRLSEVKNQIFGSYVIVKETAQLWTPIIQLKMLFEQYLMNKNTDNLSWI